MSDGSFYVGYMPRMHRGLARFVRTGVTSALLIVATAGVLFGAAHRPYDEAYSDAADIREFEGIFIAQPVPQLIVPRPNDGGFSRYLVIGRGKYGPKPDVMNEAGGWARLKGSLTYRDGLTALLVKTAEAIATPSGALEVGELAAAQELGPATLRGEIVDSKCFLGVMRPGNTKVHRQCATRCIAGGVPPVLLVRTEDGSAVYLLLVGEDGDSIGDAVLPYVAEPIEIHGALARADDLLMFRVDMSTIRRL